MNRNSVIEALRSGGNVELTESLVKGGRWANVEDGQKCYLGKVRLGTFDAMVRDGTLKRVRAVQNNTSRVSIYRLSAVGAAR